MILSYDAYTETTQEKQEKDDASSIRFDSNSFFIRL
jgi:hypothetical protein